MYTVELECESGHSFEGWYDCADDYEACLTQGNLSCPMCDSEFIMRRSSAKSPSGKALMNLARQLKSDELTGNGDLIGGQYFKIYLD
ncbi:MAG: DUF1178 family protein [Myxococcota bacterium]